MAHPPLPALLIPILLLLTTTLPSTSQQQCSNPAADQVRAGYWFAHHSHFNPISTINATLYTHLYYYSLPLDQSSPDISAPDPILANFSTSVKSTNPSVKTLLSIATDDQRTDESNTAFSAMAADPNLRASFIANAVRLARAYGFDGLDLGWQFPSSSTEMESLALLVAELRSEISDEAVAQNSSELLLSATVYFSNHLFDVADDNVDYPVDALSSGVDWINALSFGYRKNGNATTADAPLFNRSSHFSTSYGITSWLDAGIPPCKLVMGVPLFGRSWTLRNKAKNGVGDPVVAAGAKQKMSNQTGLIGYFEIEEVMRDSSSFYVYDNNTVSAYFHSGSLWVSFDSSEVVREKIEFALRNNLLGYFLWPISFDDSTCRISKEASDVWLGNYDAPNVRYEDGFEQALSPFQLPPEDILAPTPSRAVSGLKQKVLTMDLYHVLFLLFFLAVN